MERLKVYQLSIEFSQKVWDLVVNWPYFPKETVGRQIVRSADSISANLQEGAGRYFYKERNQFNIYSRGSLFETRCWLDKAMARNLISKQDFENLIKDCDLLQFEINRMIRSTRAQSLPTKPDS